MATLIIEDLTTEEIVKIMLAASEEVGTHVHSKFLIKE